MATKRQKIIITGASSGLGKQMAIEFAKQGRELHCQRVDWIVGNFKGRFGKDLSELQSSRRSTGCNRL